MSDRPGIDFDQIRRDLMGKLFNKGGLRKGFKTPKEYEKEINNYKNEGRIDLVTGLSNEKVFSELLNGLEDRWKRDYNKGVHDKGSFIVMDLGGLHETNDTFGREAGGNDYLRAVANTISSVARGSDRCFRMGTSADEFVLYIPETVAEKDLNAVMDRIDSTLKDNEEKNQKKYPGIKFQLSYSVSAFGRGYSPQMAYEGASNMMGKAKESKNGERVGDVGRLFDNSYN